MTPLRTCSRCELPRPAASFQMTGGGYRHTVCPSCVSGAHRLAALARSRPHMRQLVPEAWAVLEAWETARLAFKRALLPHGVELVLSRGDLRGQLVQRVPLVHPVALSGGNGGHPRC